MNDLQHTGVKGMKWGHRKTSKNTKNTNKKQDISETAKQMVSKGRSMSNNLLIKVQQQVEQQHRINQQNEFTQQQINQQQMFNQQNQIFDQQNTINQMNMPMFY